MKREDPEYIPVHKGEKFIYNIVISSSFDCLFAAVGPLELSGRKICIVTDSNVEPLYLEEVLEIYEKAAYRAFSFTLPSGEEHKTLDAVRQLYTFLIENSFDRGDVLVALGGGVVGDLTGYTAATYLRGIRFIQMPTTLLSQVDASIGGKTGVDFDSYKNMVGAFYMPSLVYMNISALQSLPDDQFSSGMAEVIKHGCILDAGYFGYLSDNREAIKKRNPAHLAETVKESCLIKRSVVEEDPTEKGRRALLNYGHTLGHAIEKEMNFKMSHGACVALGMMAASFISVSRGLISEQSAEMISELLSYFGLPTQFAGADPDMILDSVKHDKKMDSGVIKFILLKDIGDAYTDKTVTSCEMRSALKFISAKKED